MNHQKNPRTEAVLVYLEKLDLTVRVKGKYVEPAEDEAGGFIPEETTVTSKEGRDLSDRLRGIQDDLGIKLYQSNSVLDRVFHVAADAIRNGQSTVLVWAGGKVVYLDPKESADAYY